VLVLALFVDQSGAGKLHRLGVTLVQAFFEVGHGPSGFRAVFSAALLGPAAPRGKGAHAKLGVPRTYGFVFPRW
jgi:hypothetical protein